MNIIILLGSNLGDRLANLQQAITSIASFSTILQQSNIYQTAAWGNTDQADFLNQAIEIQTQQTAENLMHALLAIESQMGRVRLQKWEPRIIDLDIIFYGTFIVMIQISLVLLKRTGTCRRREMLFWVATVMMTMRKMLFLK